MKRVHSYRDARRGNRITITLGGVEHVMTVHQAADLAAEIQQEIVTFVNTSVQLAIDKHAQASWRERAIAALRERKIRGPASAQEFLAGVMKVYTFDQRKRDPRYKDLKEDDDALAFTSDRELELLIKEHGVEVREADEP